MINPYTELTGDLNENTSVEYVSPVEVPPKVAKKALSFHKDYIKKLKDRNLLPKNFQDASEIDLDSDDPLARYLF